MNEMNTSPASYKRFQKFAFVDRLLRFYLRAVDMLRNDIRSQLQAFDYTGDGNILRHFVKEALRRVTPKLSALEIQTLHDAGCSMIRTYKKKLEKKGARRNGSSSLNINHFMMQIQNVFLRPSSMVAIR